MSRGYDAVILGFYHEMWNTNWLQIPMEVESACLALPSLFHNQEKASH